MIFFTPDLKPEYFKGSGKLFFRSMDEYEYGRWMTFKSQEKIIMGEPDNLNAHDFLVIPDNDRYLLIYKGWQE